MGSYDTNEKISWGYYSTGLTEQLFIYNIEDLVNLKDNKSPIK